MIHYHGVRHSTWQVAVEICRRRHALVSFADPQQIAIAAEVAQSFALDNGAFSVWKQGLEVDWQAYYAWVEQWLRHPGFDWAIIPDVIEGDEAAKRCAHRRLAVRQIRRSTRVASARIHRSPVAARCGVAASGTGFERPVLDGRHAEMVQQAMEAICVEGRPIVKLHGLRMLRPAICKHLPLGSADSAGVSRGVGTTNWGGCYRQASDQIKAQVLLDSYESAQGAAVWAAVPRQEELFA
jgi:hypothetical protein